MRKSIVIILLILCVFIGISAVSANENASVSNDVLGMEHSDEVIQAEQSYLDSSLAVDESSQSNIVKSSAPTEDSSNKNTNQIPSKATANDIKSVYGTPATFNLKVVDKEGKGIVGKQVKFVIGKKTYNVQTDDDGVASLKLNYAAGKYTIKYYVGNLLGKNTYTVKNKITLTILKWGNKGDVSKVKLIKKNMPNNKWVKMAVAATKKGNPLLMFQGGNGKKIFITAGVHGNELSSQVAVMKLIAHLSKTPIKGTVYIIPFVNIKAISNKVRHTGADYNRVAHKSGTISNKIVNLVAEYKCDAYGDFHTSKPGGAPGQNIVMGSKTPAKKSASLTKYIAKHAKVNKRLYKYAGKEYPGALADNVNKKRIPAVICEVVLPHNTVTSQSVKISYRMMNCLLKFNNVI